MTRLRVIKGIGLATGISYPCCDHCVVVGNPHHPEGPDRHSFPCTLGCKPGRST